MHLQKEYYKEWQNIMNDIKTMYHMIKQIRYMMTKKQMAQMFGVFLLISMGSIFELLGVSTILLFIQAIVTPELLSQKAYVKLAMDILHINGHKGMLIMVGCGIVCVYVIKNIYLLLTDYIQTKYSCNMQKELSTLMYDCYLSRPYSFFTSTDSGRIIRGINADANQVFVVIQHIFKFLTEVLTIVFMSIYLLYVDFTLAIGLIIIAIITFILIVFVIKRKISAAGNECREANADTTNWCIQTIEGIKDILVFSKRNYVVSKYKKIYKKLTSANITYNFLILTPDKLIETLCVSGIIIIVVFRLWCGMDVVSLVPTLSAFAVAAFKMMPCISHATGYVSVFIYSRPYVESAYDNVIEARKCMKNVADEDEMERECVGKIHLKSKIEMKEINWKYDEGNRNIFNDMNLNINVGEAVGIVGESGAGKSTLADILLGLYRPQKGNILADGIDINNIPNEWKESLSYVPQTVFLLNDTIRENVAFGGVSISDELVWEALEKSNLLKYVKSLPNQLDTIVGERGIKFSGGQRQRIAIARALYRNPEILILDEATSALDNETENVVMDSITKLQGTITMIIIAHRLTTIEKCDRIYEIRNGKAYEETEKYKKQ